MIHQKNIEFFLTIWWVKDSTHKRSGKSDRQNCLLNITDLNFHVPFVKKIEVKIEENSSPHYVSKARATISAHYHNFELALACLL